MLHKTIISFDAYATDQDVAKTHDKRIMDFSTAHSIISITTMIHFTKKEENLVLATVIIYK